MPPRDQQAWRRAVSRGTSIAMEARAKRTRCPVCQRAYGWLLDRNTFRMEYEVLDGVEHRIITVTECKYPDCAISFTLA